MLGGIFQDIIPIVDKNINSFDGITIYKNFIYLLSKKFCTISVYDLSYNFIKYISLRNFYCDISYDFYEDVFLAVSSSGRICKLSPLNMCEIDSKKIPVSTEKFKNISFDKTENLIVIMSEKTISLCNKDGIILKEIKSPNGESNASICNIENFTVKFSNYKNCQETILKKINMDFTTENLGCLPKDFICMSSSSFHNDTLYILAYKNFYYPYILKYKIIKPNENICEFEEVLIVE